MNQGIYKLVYSKVLNMYVPASEAARNCGNKSSRRIRKHANISLRYILIVCFFFVDNALADPAGLIPGTQAWINATITGATNNSMTITQTAPKAILDWQKLNLNAGELLKFNQQGNRTWSALNRIHDLNPSILDGTVLADGNVYFINTNGIIFGKNAQFNVGSLYAGALDITNDLFNSGFVNENTFTNVFGDGITGIGGFVTVEKGAQINTVSGGKVLLFAPTVTNNGIINTPDGQTILAAGNKVYLQSSKDPAGFLVEVDSGGTATNLGKIVAERGNITMMGLAVNQAGTLTATTSVRANGSIRLLAQDKANVSGVDVIGARNGIVTLAKDSVTEVNPEYANKEETIASQAFITSDVKIEASLVNLDGKISAKGGNVTISALNPASAELNSQNTSRIYLGNNAVIDVSGVDAVAPMSRNQLEIQLFSDQLKDAPILRDTGLFKDTVYVDARKGTQLFDIQPFLNLKGATVAEKMTKAGSINLSTPNDLIAEKGSILNVSGGSTTYEAGPIRETNLYYNGKLVPISEAKPGVPYDKTADVYTVKDAKWGVTRSWDLSGGGTQGWGNVTTGSANKQLKATVVGSQVASYLEGDDAGTLNLTVKDDKVTTQNLVLAGNVLANTKVSTQQLLNQIVPKGGKFVASANDLVIAKNANELVSGFTFEQKLDDNFQSSISTNLLEQGFNDVDLTKTNKLQVNDAMHLNPNGKLLLNRNLDGNTTEIKADIVAPSGNITLAGSTTITDGVKVSTAGLFTNDKSGIAGQYSQPAAINGGSINATLLTFGKNVTLDASAGASVDNKGVLHEGEASDIKFTTLSKIDDSVALQAYGFKQGGKLDVAFGLAGNEKTVNIGGHPNASATDIGVSNDFFNKGGFSKYSISGFNVNIGDNSAAAPQEVYATAQTWRMNANFANDAGGQPIASVASPFVQLDATRPPVSLSISADKLGGVLTLAENATLRTDRGGSINLAAGKQVNVLGGIVTPSGAIEIKINDKDGSLLYDPTQAIFIGANANLSAIGSSVIFPDSQPDLLKTQVFNAGTITIDAPKGTLVIKEGAVLDVSGTSIVNDTKTATGFTRETLHGDAGTIKLSASDGLLLDGSFRGAATGTGRGGTLDVGFTSTRLDVGAPILTGNREFTITQQKQLVAQNFTAGDALKTAIGDAYTETSADTIRAGISADQVKQGSFANLKVKSFAGDSSLGLKDSIQLENGLDLQLAGNLKLETPQVNVKNDGLAKLTASHIALKSPNSSVDNASIAAGEGKLTTQSKQLYIDGLMAIAGVNETSINTTQDISGQGTQIAKDGLPSIAGGLVANGDINLKARQIYPNTAAKLSFEAVGANSTINVLPSGVAAKPVLSAGGTLSLTAENVVQSGVLTAPFGEIIVDATKSAIFTAGSVTSVSANNQTIPYGTTSTGGQVYNPAAGASTPLPEKAITIKSANVDLQKNAVLDLSAGGDMFAYEFVPGIGGSKDVLAQPNTYAVIPNLGQDYAPIDQVYSESSVPVGVGQSVYLTGVPGLAAGTYTLLPARYALVPGAFLVEANVVGSKLLPTQVAPQLDGATLTTGYRADLGTGARDANWSTFKVSDGAIFRPAAGTISKAPSQYILTSANTFFADPNKTSGKKVSLPQDVGRLSIDAAKLALDGVVVANKVAGGAGLNVDISSTNIRVVNNQDLLDTGSLQLTASSINALNAESLLLGGNRKLKDGVVDITTGAETISFENDSNNTIKTPEFIATATDKITVKTGAVIDTGATSKTPAKKDIRSNGDGALLALSSTGDISYSRTGGSPASTKGELNIEAGSTLKAGNSVVLDATKSANLAGNVTLQDGGSATLGANRILIGNAAIDTIGLNVNAVALAALGQLKALTLNSYNNIDTFGTVNFGNDKLNLTMNAAGIVGHLANGEVSVPVNAGSSVITAKTFTLKNTQGAEFVAPIDASDRALEINAATVKLDGGETVSGKTEVTGFTKVDIKADEIRVAKIGEANFNVAETKLTTGRISADTAANYKIASTDQLTIALLANAKRSSEQGFGAKLDIAAKDLTVASNIDLSSGKLSLTSINNLNIATGSTISATSTPISYYNKIKYAPAGSVTLTSATGNVNVDSGAVVDVTSQDDANAGLVKVVATSGTTNIAGDLKGGATGTGKAGVLDVDVKTLVDLTATDTKAAGFSEGRQYRVRNGDVNITGTGTNALIARETSVSADAGKITISGEIIATAPKNSSIGLYADKGITLESTAKLEAKSTKAVEDGGKVTITSTSEVLDNTPDQLNFKAGSMIDVSGGTNGKGGKVNLTAPRTLDNTDIEIAQLGTTFVGVKDSVNINGLKTYDTTSVTVVNRTAGTNESESFMISALTNSSKGLQRLGVANNPQFTMTPGVEFRNKTGDLTLATDWDLHDARFDPITGLRVIDVNQLVSGVNASGDKLLAGTLNLRAAGNVLMSGTLSDGFSSANLNVLSQAAAPEIPAIPEVLEVLDADGNVIIAGVPEIPAVAAQDATGVIGLNSWSYNIVAGTDFAAANSLATIGATKDPITGNAISGNVIVANNKGIRTGTGNINIAAGGDLKMNNTGSVIYTTGHNASILEGFDSPVTTQSPLYLTDGGDISIATKGSIIGGESSTTSNRQLINQWLFRQGNQNKDTSWWVRPDKFQQGVATLGGGDVNINADGNISNFSASTPTTARFDTNGTTGNQIINGGGDIKVKAGGDINNGIYFVAKGDGEISATGSIQKQGNFGTILALQDGNFIVSTGKDSFIEAAINPTLVSQSLTNAPLNDTNTNNSYFNTYASQAEVNVTSLTGDVVFGGGSNILSSTAGLRLGITETLKYAPGRLNLAAHNGDVNIGNLVMLPTTNGDFEVFASDNVKLADITMSDADVALLPNAYHPVNYTLINTSSLGRSVLGHSVQPLNINNTEAVIIVAEHGNIDKLVTVDNTAVVLPKMTKLVAGQDVKNLKLVIQNNNASDVSLIKAGNDILVGNTTLSGPGNLLLQAGRNIDLTNTSADIATTGNSGNSAAAFLDPSRGSIAGANSILPAESASITLQAGLGNGANVQGYIDRYILPTGDGPAALVGDAAKLTEYRVAAASAVTAYMRKTTNNNSLTDVDALAQFNALDLERKTIFANRHLTTELIASAKGFAKAGNHDRGNSAIATLFPTLNQGDILLYASKVSTNSGGSIDLIAPGGLINVGAPGKQFKDDALQSGDIGVITEKGGAIRAIANGDFQVNQSKLITQFGSDIAIWSNTGTIDAGRGSKTATSIPERIVLTDANGNTTIEVKGVAAGSGIRAQTYDPDGPNGSQIAPPKGNIYLTAPKVDAGEAGIEAGDLFIVAPIVLNAANIQVSGTSSGVPVAATSSLAGVGAGLSPDSVNAATAAVAQSVAQSTNQPFVKPVLPSIITVEVIE
jgi:filamentous hemagglutinin